MTPLRTEIYSGTSLLQSAMGLDKSDLNGEVAVLQGLVSGLLFSVYIGNNLTEQG